MREAAQKLSLDLDWPKRSRRKKDPDPDDQEETDKAFGDISDDEQTFWLSTYRKDTALMQVCHCSDRMSAVFGPNLERDVSVPLLLGDNFDAEQAFSAIQTVTPVCLWISISDISSVDTSAWLYVVIC